jgi:hypothetical protein
MTGRRNHGSPSLQKSCNACAKAKRKCDKLCPCSRCQADGIVCKYKNLPWLSRPAGGAMIAPVKRREGDILDLFFKGSNEDESTALKRRHRFSTTGTSLSHSMHPSSLPIVRSLEETDFKMLIASLRDLPAACIHNSRITGISPDVLLDPILVGKQTQAVLSSIPPLVDLLQTTQSLLALQAISIFHSDNRIREHAQKQQPMLMQLSHRLWLEAPTSLPHTMTAHAAWKLGESIRRTIIASHLLAAAASACNTGSVHYQPFLASLPFDRRIALWSMEDDDPWLAYIDAKQTPLFSLQEWLQGDENSDVQAASVLQRILLILYQPWTHRRLGSRI